MGGSLNTCGSCYKALTSPVSYTTRDYFTTYLLFGQQVNFAIKYDNAVKLYIDILYGSVINNVTTNIDNDIDYTMTITYDYDLQFGQLRSNHTSILYTLYFIKTTFYDAAKLQMRSSF